MNSNGLRIAGFIIGLGVISPFSGTSATLAQPNLVPLAQNRSFILAKKPGQSLPAQPLPSPEDLRSKQQQDNQELQRRRQELLQRQQDALLQQRQQKIQNQQQDNQELQRRRQELLQRQQDALLQQRQQKIQNQQQDNQELQRRRQELLQRQQDALLQQRQQKIQNQQQDNPGQQSQTTAYVQQRQRLIEFQKRHQINRQNRQDEFNHRISLQRYTWQQNRSHSRSIWLRQQSLVQPHLYRVDPWHQDLYHNYVVFYDYDYWNDSSWRSRNYWDNRSFWSGSGYWYERDYWSQRGYIWDDVLGALLKLLLGGLFRGGIGSGFSNYYPSNQLYYQGPQILTYNGLTQSACIPGNVVILLPNQRVMCALPNYSFVPGTYQIGGLNLGLIPAEIEYY
jgi:hypothetical protein